MHLLKKDIQAFVQFNYENSAHQLDDFYINYLGVSKVESYVNRDYKGVVTSSNIPCIEHEDLIRAGWTRFNQTFMQMDYDPKKGLFLPKEPSKMQIKANNEKKEQLQDELGVKIDLGYTY